MSDLVCSEAGPELVLGDVGRICGERREWIFQMQYKLAQVLCGMILPQSYDTRGSCVLCPSPILGVLRPVFGRGLGTQTSSCCRRLSRESVGFCRRIYILLMCSMEDI
jgi:hypothetical protein